MTFARVGWPKRVLKQQLLDKKMHSVAAMEQGYNHFVPYFYQLLGATKEHEHNK